MTGLRHKNVVSGRIREAEFEHPNQHILDSQEAGDIIIATTSAQLARLAKGNDGEVLQLASGLPSWVNLKNAVDYGLAFYGVVTTATDTTHFKVSSLADFGAGWFKPNAGAAYEIYVVQAEGAAPEGEQTPVVAYTTGDGTFQHAVFTAQLAVGDEVLILHPLLSSLGTKATAAASGAVTTTDYMMAYIKQLVSAVIVEAASTARVLNTLDFWSLPQEEVALTGTAGDKSLPSVVVADLPAGATIVRAIAMFKFRSIENHTFAGVNKLDGAQEIQVKENAAGSFIDAINLVDDQFTIAETTREGGDVIIGAIDVKAQVDGNDTYAFQWDEAWADETGINFNDVQCGIRVWYSL